VESPTTDTDHVKRNAHFTEQNPHADMAVFHLGPRAGRAAVSTRLRLATTQVITAVCEMSDGGFWSSQAHVIVTLAACVETL
ncbi:MAG: thiosulfate oxidation carrier protein SoxY, partial [Amphiplicatus sp.]